ncbi:MAG: metallopeptidase [Clostridia bacterium]|nr:metallopeptidase [Clostridia bacterium]
MNQNEQNERILALAQEVLKLSRNTLLVNLRYLDLALSRLIPVPCEKGTIMTEGTHLIFEPKYLLKSYKLEKEAPPRNYLHIVLHCVFQHMYIDPSINRSYWDLACDMAVEAVISELGIHSVQMPSREEIQAQTFKTLGVDQSALTAEKIYHALIQEKPDELKVAKLRGAFYGDNHEPWYMTSEEIEKKFGTTLPKSQSHPNEDENEGDNEGEDSGNGNNDTVKMRRLLSYRAQDAEEWKKIAHRMSVDMETFSQRQGYSAGNMMQNLKAVTREKYDYTQFLKKFAVMGEAMKINNDEFDYIYYTYGLQLYEKMPLIEPLEYKEVKRIKEFVIAIDTSGSVSGPLVQTFIQKTYNILKSTESFFSKINLHIIQCDAKIQEAIKITSQEEFDAYLANMKIHGLGGTDFRPVFSYVNELVAQKEFQNLKGLIYFTDGHGTFPEKKPPYETAFVFIDDNYNNIDVPPWAIKLILQKEDI